MSAYLRPLSLAAALFIASTSPGAEPSDWKLALADPGTSAWETRWFLDGDLAGVKNTPEGIVLTSGPVEAKDAGHAVLWTKASFKGDLKIEYDFTRLDNNRDHTSVCILYFQATGVGTPKYPVDIFSWRDLRKVPTMSLYFTHMNAYHISYACTGGPDNDYVRARRYPTKGHFQKDTLIEPSYERVNLFATGETWHIAVECIGRSLKMSASSGSQVHTWTWDASTYPPLTEGRIGLRQMRGRESRYANLRVFTKVPSGN